MRVVKKTSSIALVLGLALLTGCQKRNSTISDNNTNLPQINVVAVSDNNYSSMIMGNANNVYCLYKGNIYEIKNNDFNLIIEKLDTDGEMAVTDSYLYYIKDNALNRFDIESGETKTILSQDRFDCMYSNEDDVFVRFEYLSGNKGAMPNAAAGNVYYFTGDDANGTVINELDSIDEYKIISCDGDYEGTTSVQAVVSDNGWSVTFNYQNIYLIKNNQLIDYKSTEKSIDDVGFTVAAPFISYEKNDFYCLGQKNNATHGGVNIKSKDSLGDGIYKLKLENDAFEEIYSTSNSDRIIGYSIEKNEVYIYRDYKIYVQNMTTAEEKVLGELEKSDKYSFDWEENELYVIYEKDGNLKLKIIKNS